ncbi:putative LPS assembly protein LptD [Dinghuibacter silviterrae]|uniref:putative LPS assembly protein LptD n=1 Tax=Dinghuibacter silviterrae TaxID=1539049 RepID=UPI0010636D63|nr:putative LPS assembly protein LptD [Dinghuibacter silviterrae]
MTGIVCVSLFAVAHPRPFSKRAWYAGPVQGRVTVTGTVSNPLRTAGDDTTRPGATVRPAAADTAHARGLGDTTHRAPGDTTSRAQGDTTGRAADTTHRTPGDTTSRASGDSTHRLVLDSLAIPLAKDSLDAPISYAAEDSMVLDIPHKRVLLYDQATTDYKDLKLKSGIIVMDQTSQVLTALPAPGVDSNGLLLQRPEFTQKQDLVVSDSMKYNMKSKKGLSFNADGQEGEMFIHSQRSKKIDNNTFYAYNARFTTCDLDTPHFAFRAKRIKYISGKFAITGYTRPEFEGIPFPIGIPYGIFPLVDGQHSGLLPPAFTVNDQQGLGLTGLGYYKVISQNMDFLIKGNIYSYGSWELDLDPSYYVRYHYRGSVNFSVIDTKIAFKGDPDYQQSTNFNLQWAHTQDTKAHPGITFNSSVNLMTSKYNQYQTNYIGQVYQNQVQSSVAYTRTFTGTPFYFSAAFSQNQNTQQRLWNVSLPNLNFTMNTIYPFQKKDQVGTKKWYQNLGIGYNGSYQTLMSFYDTAFSFKQVLDTLQWGVHHTIPITLSLPSIFNHAVQIAPSVSYDETWFSRQLIKTWDNKNSKLDTTIYKGFFQQRQMTYGVSTSTALYGTFNFGNGYVKAIRHVIRPQIGFSYQPDLNKGAYYSVQIDTFTNGGTQQPDWGTYNKYAGGIFSPYSQGTFGGINFTLDNNLEMKVRNGKDTTGSNPYKKVKLIDNFGISTSYNLVADSFQLAPISLYARSNLFNKINFSGGATLSPYQTNAIGNQINKYVWSGHNFSVGRFVSGYVSASTTFESKKAKGQENVQDSLLNNKDLNNPNAMSDDQRELNYIRSNPAEFANFNIPWHLSLSYSLTISRQLNSNSVGYINRTTQSVNFNGDFNLTPNWKIIGSGTFSIDSYSFQFLQASIARNLHCWQMAINVTPLGYYRSFSITLSPKSGILRDLRINRTRSYYSNIPGY